MRSDPPPLFWSLVLSAVSALPLAVRDVSIVATDVVPNGFNELVKLSQWQCLTDKARRLKKLASLTITFAGMDDFRLAQHARATFSENFNTVLRQREGLLLDSKISASFRFVPDVERLV